MLLLKVLHSMIFISKGSIVGSIIFATSPNNLKMIVNDEIFKNYLEITSQSQKSCKNKNSMKNICASFTQIHLLLTFCSICFITDLCKPPLPPSIYSYIGTSHFLLNYLGASCILHSPFLLNTSLLFPKSKDILSHKKK